MRAVGPASGTIETSDAAAGSWDCSAVPARCH